MSQGARSSCSNKIDKEKSSQSHGHTNKISCKILFGLNFLLSCQPIKQQTRPLAHPRNDRPNWLPQRLCLTQVPCAPEAKQAGPGGSTSSGGSVNEGSSVVDRVVVGSVEAVVVVVVDSGGVSKPGKPDTRKLPVLERDSMVTSHCDTRLPKSTTFQKMVPPSARCVLSSSEPRLVEPNPWIFFSFMLAQLKGKSTSWLMGARHSIQRR